MPPLYTPIPRSELPGDTPLRHAPFLLDELRVMKKTACSLDLVAILHSDEIASARIELTVFCMFPCPDEYTLRYTDDAPTDRFYPEDLRVYRGDRALLDTALECYHPELGPLIMPLVDAQWSVRECPCSPMVHREEARERITVYLDSLADHVLGRVGLRTCRDPRIQVDVRQRIVRRLVMAAADDPHDDLLAHATAKDAAAALFEADHRTTTAWFRRSVVEPLKDAYQMAKLPYRTRCIDDYLSTESRSVDPEEQLIPPRQFVILQAIQQYYPLERARYPRPCPLIHVRLLNGTVIELRNCVPTEADVVHALHCMDHEQYPYAQTVVTAIKDEAGEAQEEDAVPMYAVMCLPDDPEPAVTLVRTECGVYLSPEHHFAIEYTVNFRVADSCVREEKEDQEDDRVQSFHGRMQFRHIQMRFGHSLVDHTFFGNFPLHGDFSLDQDPIAFDTMKELLESVRFYPSETDEDPRRFRFAPHVISTVTRRFQLFQFMLFHGIIPYTAQ